MLALKLMSIVLLNLKTRFVTQAFNEVHPDIRLNWVPDSTGIVTARLLAKKNPRADVIWRLVATSMMLMDDQGMLKPNTSEDLEKLSRQCRES